MKMKTYHIVLTHKKTIVWSFFHYYIQSGLVQLQDLIGVVMLYHIHVPYIPNLDPLHSKMYSPI